MTPVETTFMSDKTDPSVRPLVEVAPNQPSDKVVEMAIAVLSQGGVIAFPTDTLYGIGCALDQPHASQRIQRMRGFDSARRPLTMLLPDVGQLPHYVTVGESAHRILNRIFPGPYCAEFLANRSVPAHLVHEERRTIGVRIPDTAFCEKLLWGLGQPMLTATAKSRTGHVLENAADIQREYGADLDLILDGGVLTGPPSTVVSLTDEWATVLREGRGPANKILVA
jgi:tRNA threonylcarbamoyl adenosine modification protein (Sua5/YciO/YrdC/YwlC family)